MISFFLPIAPHFFPNTTHSHNYINGVSWNKILIGCFIFHHTHKPYLPNRYGPEYPGCCHLSDARNLRNPATETEPAPSTDWLHANKTELDPSTRWTCCAEQKPQPQQRAKCARRRNLRVAVEPATASRWAGCATRTGTVPMGPMRCPAVSIPFPFQTFHTCIIVTHITQSTNTRQAAVEKISDMLYYM